MANQVTTRMQVALAFASMAAGIALLSQPAPDAAQASGRAEPVAMAPVQGCATPTPVDPVVDPVADPADNPADGAGFDSGRGGLRDAPCGRA